MDGAVRLTGRDLDPARGRGVARDGAPVEIDAGARARIEAGRSGGGARRRGAATPVYGVTTGLGSRVVEAVDGAEAAAFSLRTLRGRATAVGEPLRRRAVARRDGGAAQRPVRRRRRARGWRSPTGWPGC